MLVGALKRNRVVTVAAEGLIGRTMQGDDIVACVTKGLLGRAVQSDRVVAQAAIGKIECAEDGDGIDARKARDDGMANRCRRQQRVVKIAAIDIAYTREVVASGPAACAVCRDVNRNASCRVRVIKEIVAIADHGIVASAALEPGLHRRASYAAVDQKIIAIAANEDIGAAAAIDRIITSKTNELISARVTCQLIGETRSNQIFNTDQRVAGGLTTAIGMQSEIDRHAGDCRRVVIHPIAASAAV